MREGFWHAGLALFAVAVAVAVAVAGAVGCSFTAPASSTDAALDDAPLVDPDVAPDVPAMGRVTENLVALWNLDENGGATVGMSAGSSTPVAFSIIDVTKVTWQPGTLTVDAPTDIRTPDGNNPIIPPIKQSDEVTLEVWVTPAMTVQTGANGQPARIVTLTQQNMSIHAIGLGQLGGGWAAQLRTSATIGMDPHGGPILLAEPVTMELTHLVVVSTATERRFYVNGVSIGDALGGTLDNWSNQFIMLLGGDPVARNTWRGTIHLVAIYDQALAPDEVMRNYLAGP